MDAGDGGRCQSRRSCLEPQDYRPECESVCLCVCHPAREITHTVTHDGLETLRPLPRQSITDVCTEVNLVISEKCAVPVEDHVSRVIATGPTVARIYI